jgi:hypothetical protein
MTKEGQRFHKVWLLNRGALQFWTGLRLQQDEQNRAVH